MTVELEKKSASVLSHWPRQLTAHREMQTYAEQ